MREAGRPIPPPSKAAVSKHTVGINNGLYETFAKEASRQGLSVDAIVDAALIQGFGALLKRIESAPAMIERPAEAR